MADDVIILKAKDCHIIEGQEGHGEAIQYFISRQSEFQTFQFDLSAERDKPELAYFNYQQAKWYAGRMVGEASFEFKGQHYKFKVQPRFGDVQLFRMLEEIFNLRLSESQTTIEKQANYQVLIRKLIAFLWLSMLAKANQHGLPRINMQRRHKGAAIKGRLNVRKSIIPYYTEDQLVSEYREKDADSVIVRILQKAYDILMLSYGLGQIRQSEGARNAIEQMKVAYYAGNAFVSDRAYHNIKYKSIYLSFKPIVDLSWDIIKKQGFGNQKKEEKGSSFFIDMAELWELYLKSILKKRFGTQWRVYSPTIQVYTQKDFCRSMIPDIVMEKGKDVMIWDAKYKDMQYRYYDYDRADFFQIHTYLQYYAQRRNVIAGGLLYPLSKLYDSEVQRRNRSDSLFGLERSSTQFIVEGIDFNNLSKENIKEKEEAFLQRIATLLPE